MGQTDDAGILLRICRLWHESTGRSEKAARYSKELTVTRDGQKKIVHIYRLLTTNTIDEKIYQVSENALSRLSVDRPSSVILTQE